MGPLDYLYSYLYSNRVSLFVLLLVLVVLVAAVYYTRIYDDVQGYLTSIISQPTSTSIPITGSIQIAPSPSSPNRSQYITLVVIIILVLIGLSVYVWKQRGSKKQQEPNEQQKENKPFMSFANERKWVANLLKGKPGPSLLNKSRFRASAKPRLSKVKIDENPLVVEVEKIRHSFINGQAKRNAIEESIEEERREMMLSRNETPEETTARHAMEMENE